MIDPTTPQIVLVRTVLDYYAAHGRAPTYRELARALRVNLKSAWRRAFYCEKKGLLGPRLTLTDAGRSAVALSPGG
jgi:hypothetical protein